MNLQRSTLLLFNLQPWWSVTLDISLHIVVSCMPLASHNCVWKTFYFKRFSIPNFLLTIVVQPATYSCRFQSSPRKNGSYDVAFSHSWRYLQDSFLQKLAASAIRNGKISCIFSLDFSTTKFFLHGTFSQHLPFFIFLVVAISKELLQVRTTKVFRLLTSLITQRSIQCKDILASFKAT